MTDTRLQFVQRIKHEAAKHIKEVPPGSNICEITHRFEKRFGWGDREPWCAQGVTVVGLDGGVLRPAFASAGAWDLTDRMTAAGLRRTLATVHFPAVLSFNYGNGHVGFLLGYNPVTQNGLTWECNTGSGNPAEGDGAYYRSRYLGGNAIHAICDLEFAPDAKGVTTGKPADRFLYEKTPPFVGLDVRGVANAMVIAGNRQLLTDPSYTKGIYTHGLGLVVNQFNINHHVKDPKTGQAAHGVTPASLAEMRKLVHH